MQKRKNLQTEEKEEKLWQKTTDEKKNIIEYKN